MTDNNEEVDYQENGDEYEEEYADYDEEKEMLENFNKAEKEFESLDQSEEQLGKKLSDISDQIDENSIYVGQVDYSSTSEELRAHFSSCGTINRITIICDKWGHSKGFAYIEFLDKESMEKALALDDSQFKGRSLKVLPKRQNLPFHGRGGRGGRGRGRSTRGRGGRVPYRGRGFYGGRRGRGYHFKPYS